MSLIEDLKELVDQYEEVIDGAESFNNVWRAKTASAIQLSNAYSEWHDDLKDADDLVDFFDNITERQKQELRYEEDQQNELTKLELENEKLECALAETLEKNSTLIDFDKLWNEAGQTDEVNLNWGIHRSKVIEALKTVRL